MGILFPTTCYGRITLLAAIIQTLIISCIEAVIGAYFFESLLALGINSPIRLHLIIFITSQLFGISLLWDAVN